MSETGLTILHPAWRDEFEATTYPFGDWATLTSNTGVFIPEGTFLDASIYPVGGGSRLRLSKVVVEQQTITIYIGNDSKEELCSGVIEFLNPVDEIRLTDAYDRPAGLLVSEEERLAIFQTWPTSIHKFTFAQAGLCPFVCVPIVEDHLLGFELDDGSIVSGDVWLVGGDGVILTYEENENARDDCDVQNAVDPLEARIKVNIVGDPLFRQRLCSTGSITPKFLKQLTFKVGCTSNVVAPNAHGRVRMSTGRPDGESTILRIHGSGGILNIGAVGEELDG